ncbi:MAG: SPOR domain-containing protein [Bdellovibrionales bacterium]|nr:SPOR domain-containing protein [Bdellovibrionales bacterium]
MLNLKPRIQLDRVEIMVVFSIFILVGGMTFILGVLVGHGLGARDSGAAAHLSASTEKTMGEHGEHAVEHVAEAHHEEKSARKPASVEGAPGSELRKAFRDSKQRALVEMALRDDVAARPRSVLDAEAHLAAHPEWSRKPSSLPAPDTRSEEAEAARKRDEDREKAGVPSTVKHLFERKPSAIDAFSPKSGQFTIQIASYSTADESQSKVAELRRSGFNEAYMEPTKKKGGETWYRVNVGSFPNQDWANRTGQRLVRRGLSHDFVIRQVP